MLFLWKNEDSFLAWWFTKFLAYYVYWFMNLSLYFFIVWYVYIFVSSLFFVRGFGRSFSIYRRVCLNFYRNRINSNNNINNNSDFGYYLRFSFFNWKKILCALFVLHDKTPMLLKAVSKFKLSILHRTSVAFLARKITP